MEDVVLSTLEGLVEAIEDWEEPLVFLQGKQDTLVILGLKSGTGGGGEGNGGGGGEDKPTEWESEPSGSEEEDEEEEDMVDPNLEDDSGTIISPNCSAQDAKASGENEHQV